MDDIYIKIGPSDYLVLAAVLRRRALECLPVVRGELLTEITQLLAFMEPVVSGDSYFHAHTDLARSLISMSDPIPALDHIDALLVRCGGLRTQPPSLKLFASAVDW
ncbi:hypothetical protein [Paraburkholderia sacchari]|uniref:hypothetical protein n=1 Tax=Paraburkholderia sacchari TaxID=159450 RepID=UPI0005424D9E|nr:hypothetical protein [Paraburkholderia sacchari]NLP60535.1 hypothetical protein [Paraburkholderia sacchari]